MKLTITLALSCLFFLPSGLYAADKTNVLFINATILHLIGIDHERLTCKYQGRRFRLTDVHGRVIDEILS